MMKKFLLILATASGFAVLPPLAQSIKEIDAMIKNPRFYESLGSAEPILSIERNETGYQITTLRKVMQVNVHYGVGDRRLIGPAQFEFEFIEPTYR